MHLRTFLSGLPDDVKPVAALVIGASILTFIVLYHGVGLHGVMEFYASRSHRLSTGRPKPGAALLLFASSVFLMLLLHMTEVVLWSFPLSRLGFVPDASDAIYYCANAYTTLGYGTVDLGRHWRFISPIIGISGLFTFAWTTSTLVSLVSEHGKLLKQLVREREAELKLRISRGITTAGKSDTSEPEELNR